MSDRYWFRRHKYGYGWSPASPQGWALVLMVLVVALGGALILGLTSPETAWPVVAYLAVVAATLIVLLVVARRKAPPPRWQWGGEDR